MGHTKQELEVRDQARYDAAERDNRHCGYCGRVVPYGTDLGPNGEGPECLAALAADCRN